MKPKFKHDCDCCTFVKTSNDEFGQECDIYICNEHINFRYSDEVWDIRNVSKRMIGFFPENYPFIVNDGDILEVQSMLNK